MPCMQQVYVHIAEIMLGKFDSSTYITVIVVAYCANPDLLSERLNKALLLITIFYSNLKV